MKFSDFPTEHVVLNVYEAVFFISPVSHESDPTLWKIRSLKFRKYDPPSSTKK